MMTRRSIWALGNTLESEEWECVPGSDIGMHVERSADVLNESIIVPSMLIDSFL